MSCVYQTHAALACSTSRLMWGQICVLQHVPAAKCLICTACTCTQLAFDKLAQAVMCVSYDTHSSCPRDMSGNEGHACLISQIQYPLSYPKEGCCTYKQLLRRLCNTAAAAVQMQSGLVPHLQDCVIKHLWRAQVCLSLGLCSTS